VQDEHRLLDATEVAELLGMSREWVYRAVKRGALPAIPMTLDANTTRPRLRFDRDVVLAFARGERRTEATA